MGVAISNTFRSSMDWFHSWFGIALGCLLFVIFWMGSLSVFDTEIDQWMKAEERIPPVEAISYDSVVRPHLDALPVGTDTVYIYPPDHRGGSLKILYKGFELDGGTVHIHPITGEQLAPTSSLGASGFFYPFHYKLHIDWKNVGIWLVAFSAIMMICLLVSGVLIHRKILRDYFSFRPWKTVKRVTLDIHNLSGLAFLPFHFFISVTGLFYFWGYYVDWSHKSVYASQRVSVFEELTQEPSVNPTGIIQTDWVSLDSLVDRTEGTWSARLNFNEPVYRIFIRNFRDENSIIIMDQKHSRSLIGLSPLKMIYAATSGELIYDFERTAPFHTSVQWLTGLHLIKFEHLPLRWLYFLGGVAGCILIGSGNIFWMRARIRKHNKPTRVRVIRALTVGSTTGLILASGAFLLTNKTFAILAGVPKQAAYEVVAFFVIWAASFLHATLRGKASWHEQCWTIAVISLMCVAGNTILSLNGAAFLVSKNYLTTLLVDITLVISALAAILSAFKLSQSVQHCKIRLEGRK